MVHIGGGGQGAYPPLVNVIAAAVAVMIVAPQVIPEPRFDVAAALLDHVPTKSNNSFVVHSSL